MKLLLDTPVFLWWCAAPERLPAPVLAACRSPENTLSLSTLSVWELHRMVQDGHIQLQVPLPQILQQEMARNGLELLGFRPAHALALAEIPIHRPPADPIRQALVAQARVEGLTLVSPRTELEVYGISVLWNVSAPQQGHPEETG